MMLHLNNKRVYFSKLYGRFLSWKSSHKGLIILTKLVKNYE